MSDRWSRRGGWRFIRGSEMDHAGPELLPPFFVNGFWLPGTPSTTLSYSFVRNRCYSELALEKPALKSKGGFHAGRL
jgi:hypothetical protein